MNGKITSFEARAFVEAFCPGRPQHQLAKLWSHKASEAIGALVDFRSCVHRWQATGRVDEQEWGQLAERLDNCNLSDFVDELTGLALLTEV